MNPLRKINEHRRRVRTVKIECVVTLPNGKTESVVARVAVNRIGNIGGNGLTGEALYQLRKTGTCETKGADGNTYLYRVLTGTEKAVPADDLAVMNSPEYKKTLEEQVKEGEKDVETKDSTTEV